MPHWTAYLNLRKMVRVYLADIQGGGNFSVSHTKNFLDQSVTPRTRRKQTSTDGEDPRQTEEGRKDPNAAPANPAKDGRPRPEEQFQAARCGGGAADLLFDSSRAAVARRYKNRSPAAAAGGAAFPGFLLSTM